MRFFRKFVLISCVLILCRTKYMSYTFHVISYMTQISINVRIKLKSIEYLKNIDISNLATFITATSVNKYCFYSEVLLKYVVYLRILGKVLKIPIWPLFFINGRAKFEKYLIIIEKNRHNKFWYFRQSEKCQRISLLLRSVIKGCSPSQNIR